jgi:glucose-1-phosphate cytidylyltransferase
MKNNIKCVIFCGGKGTRFNLGKSKVLKPLAKINGEEILKKIINLCVKQGVKSFILLGGFKFKSLHKFSKKIKNANVIAINTGLNTTTGGRLKKIKNLLGNENFILTYGDSLANFNLKKMLKNKTKNNMVINIFDYKIEYGLVKTKKNLVSGFDEKGTVMINAGFYLLDKKIFEFINSNKDSFEYDVLPKLSQKNILKFIKLSRWFAIDNKKNLANLENLLHTKKNYFLNN